MVDDKITNNIMNFKERRTIVQTLYALNFSLYQNVHSEIKKYVDEDKKNISREYIQNILIDVLNMKNMRRMDGIDVIDSIKNDEINNILVDKLILFISGVFENIEDIENVVVKYMSSNWTLSRISKLVLCILYAAVYEILYCNNVVTDVKSGVQNEFDNNSILENTQLDNASLENRKLKFRSVLGHIITDYIEIAKNFNNDMDISFINGILDNIAKNAK